MPRKPQKRTCRPSVQKFLSQAQEPKFAESVFSSEVVFKIAHTHEISNTAGLQRALHKATRSYFLGGFYGVDTVPELKLHEQNSDKLIKASRDLLAAFELMTDRDASGLIDALLTAGVSPALTRPATIQDSLLCETDRHARFFATFTLRAVFSFLKDRRDQPRHTFANSRAQSGRRTEYGLECFVYDLAEYWALELGRPFTVNYHKGQMTSDAMIFVRDALKPLDSVPDTAVISAGRRVKKQMNNPGKNYDQ
jgi:hypothetical protein